MKDTDPFDLLIDFVTSDLLSFLMRDNEELTLSQAVSLLHNTEYYNKLSDRKTGLYFQSPGYNYELLKHELETGRYERK